MPFPTTDHAACNSALVEDAAHWLATTPKQQRPRSAVVEIKDRFGLGAREAIAAIRIADEIRQGGVYASGS